MTSLPAWEPGVRYTVDERHERILELVRQHGSLRVTDLAHHLGMSTVTLRRDVEALSGAGRLDRTRGAVSWPGAPAAAFVQGPHLIPEAGPSDLADGAGVTLGLVVPQSQYYFGEIIRGVREEVQSVGGRLVLGFSGYIPGQDEEQARRLLDSGIDGLLLTPGWMRDGSEEDAPDLDFGVPTVMLERRAAAGTQAAEFDFVCSDHYAGVGLAVRHLVSLGHRDIALLAGGSATGVHVRAGYEAALRSAGVARPPIDPIDLYEGELDTGRLERAAKRLVEAVDAGQVSAAVVLSDTDAILLLQILRSLEPQLRIPQDLAIIAYDDDVAALSDLPLTAVAPPKYEVGQEAVQLLLRRVRERRQGQGAASKRHLALLPELRVRQSCGAELKS
ncbi:MULTISPECIES: substrate-binding domain-containing protein [Streptomyces]|uniref:substrate-binding domain-containing protein n=1 Tax=unclassified Streptomyces TaxID=2593676 RepID=UPI0029BA1CB4|nr:MULTISPECIES: substrate-binding domain-containing protein [unclassified Streptomyces]MDX3768965.1 substrate-binding domain-containing protein [Streptomyces sp. AK08-01B]MDX3815631.1 substrate-binding domain-containing protein [Streptomyces sp. AK08-01A]